MEETTDVFLPVSVSLSLIISLSLSLSPPDTCYITGASCSLPLPSPNTVPKKSKHYCIQGSKAFTHIILDLITVYVHLCVQTTCVYSLC